MNVEDIRHRARMLDSDDSRRVVALNLCADALQWAERAKACAEAAEAAFEAPPESADRLVGGWSYTKGGV